MIDTLFEYRYMIGAVFLAMLLCIGIPLSQWIEYKKLCKKHGKEIADEQIRRF